MLLRLVLVACGLLFVFHGLIEAQRQESAEVNLEQIYEKLSELQREMKKGEQFHEVARLIKVDVKLKEINQKIEKIAPGSTPSQNLKDFEEDTDLIIKSVNDLQYNLEQLNVKMNILEEKETRSINEINQKLNKMFGHAKQIFELQEQNERAKSDSSHSGGSYLRSGGGSDVNSLYRNLINIEKKIVENLDVLKMQIERDSQKVMEEIRYVDEQCFNRPQVDYDASASTQIQQTDETFKFSPQVNIVQSSLTNLEENCNISKRIMSQELNNEIQSIEGKLSDFTPFISACEQGTLRSAKDSDLDEPSPQTIDQSLQALDYPSSHCTSVSHVILPKTCYDLIEAGANCDGTYVIYPMGKRAIRVFCDITGGGWTVIARRGDYGTLNHSFQQNWESYKIGFGDSNGEYWLGNENIRLLSDQDQLELAVHLVATDGAEIDFQYTRFSISGESSHYRLRLGSAAPGPNGRLATYFRHHSSHPFSTYDRDHRRGNCPLVDYGGWWHVCHNYYVKLTEPSLAWYNWKPVKAADIKIRPLRAAGK